MPVNTVGGPVVGTKNTVIALTGISVSDADSNPETDLITVHLSVVHGTLNILTNIAGGITAANITGGGNGTNGITLTATQNQINTTLAAAGGLSYQGDADFTGSDGLTVSTFNGVASDSPSFAPIAVSPALTNPTSLVTGDVNGDNILDLVYIGDVAQQVGIRLGTGTGTFGPTTTLTTGGRPTEVILTDIDGDNDLDLVSVNWTAGGSATDGVGMQLNDGAGNFGAYQTLALIPATYDVAAADLNGDGRMDLITSQRGVGQISVLLASGPVGSFAAPVTYSATADFLDSYSVVVGDFTGDGRPEIIITNYGNRTTDAPPGSVTMLTNNGDGTFGAPVNIAINQPLPFDAAAGDLNGDGNLDLVFTTHGTFKGLTVMLGNGDGTFQPGVQYAMGNAPIGVSIGDVNGDGRPDLISGSANTGTVAVFIGNGNGTFQPRVDYVTGSYFAEMAIVGDFDGDGDMDIAVNRGAGDGQGVFLNTTASRGDIDIKAITVNAVNVIDGTEGDDTINGTPADDQINGLGGDDFIQGRGGNDTLYGGDGNDLLQGDAGDAFIGPSGNDTLYGGNGDDSLRGGLGDDQLFGGDGDDHLRGNGGIDYFDGGAETGLVNQTSVYGDRVSFFEVRATQGAVADLRTGVISNDGFGNVETMTGIESLGADTAYVDTFHGNDSRNFLWGSRGDNLYGHGGDDLLYLNAAGAVDGGAGIDLLGLPSLGFLLPDANSDGLAENAPLMTSGWTVNLAAGTLVDGYGNAGTVTGVENVDGSPYGDTIRGDSNNNVLRGLDGDDFLIGFGGDDTVEGGDGNDLLRGDAHIHTGGAFGNDTLRGGAGDDHMRGGPGVDSFDGGTDTGLVNDTTGYGDRISFYEPIATSGVVADLRTGIISNDGFGNVETMTGIESLGGGTAFADTFYGNDNRNALLGGRGDNLYGFGGDDLIYLGSAAAVVDGGSGTDVLRLDSSGFWLMPDANADGVAEFAPAATSGWTINLTAGTLVDGYGNAGTVTGVENIDGSELGDTISGDSNANVLNGLDGDDTLEGGGGNDTLDGGNGIDTASYANAVGPVEVNLGSGFADEYNADETAILSTDSLANIENASGSAFNDALLGNGNANVLSGLGGNDLLVGFGGNDVINGGDGNDSLRGDGFNNYTGPSGNDTLSGGAGDDVMWTSAGVNSFDGGDGFDRVSFFTRSATQGAVASLITQTISNDGFGNSETMVSVEALGAGTAFADHLTGNDNANFLIGDRGDTLIGNGGDDTFQLQGAAALIDGGSGNDTITGFFGNVFGSIVPDGADADGLAELVFATRGVHVDLSLGMIVDDGFGNSGTLVSIENVGGSSLDDMLIGDANANVLSGLDGNDMLEGRGGNDTLDGGNGIDTASYASATGGVNVNLLTGFVGGADGSDTLVSIENVTGSAFNDVLRGNDGDNLLTGGGGDDFLIGFGGDDTVEGGDGNDLLRGDAHIHTGGAFGNDTLRGGAGDDHMRGGPGVDSFDGGTDTGLVNDTTGYGDRISFYEPIATSGVVADLRTGIISNDGFGNVETMTGIESLGGGTAFADTFYGNDNRNALLGGKEDNLYGFGGDDLIYLGSAAAVVDGGSGTDVLRLDSSGFWLMPDANADGVAEFAPAATSGWTINLTAGTLVDGYGNAGTVTGVENIDGSELGDTISGDSNANVLNGLDGDDTLEGGGGNDTLDGGNGIDTASYANAVGPVEVNLGSGFADEYNADETAILSTDTLISIENAIGSAFNDALIGNSGANVLDGAGGNDFLRGGGGNDQVFGGAGNDNISGDFGIAVLTGGGDDLVDGGDGNDIVRGRDGNDTVLGGSGDDFVEGGTGDDLIDGGSGFDRAAFYSMATTGVRVDLNLQGVAQDTGQGMDTLIGIEHVSGTPFNDVLIGDGGDNWLRSGVGTDSDTVSGGGGNDLIEMGGGNHTLDGGGGIDTLALYGFGTDITAAGVTFSLALQGTAQNTEQGMMTATNFENLGGSIYDDTLTGDASANILLGDSGNDALNGGDGNDTLYGDGRMFVANEFNGTGAITLFGDVAAAFGASAGNDTLIGGKGNDTLYGGRGNDVMSGGPGADKFIIEAQSGADRITDFAHVDRIVFDATSGVDSFSDLIFTAVGKDTLISWGTADSLLIVGYKPRDLTAADFTFSPAITASSFTSSASLNEQARATSTANSNPMLLGAVAAAGLIAVTPELQPTLVLEHGELNDGGASFSLAIGASDIQASAFDAESSVWDVSRPALTGEVREAVDGGLSSSSFALSGESLLSFEGTIAGARDAVGAFSTELSQGTVTSVFSEIAPSTLLANGVSIPAAETLLAAMNAAGGRGTLDGVGEERSMGEVWRELANVLDGGGRDAPDIDALLNALPGHVDAAAVAYSMANFDLAASDSLMSATAQWMPNSAAFTMEALALHHDAVVVT